MLVKEWMTRSIISITPETSMMKASRLMKDKKIHRLPVVNEAMEVVGIISDRDVKDASPSKATTLDMHELYYLLSELKVKDIMTKKPICGRENDSIEAMALIMMEKRFGGIPVVDANNKLVGIITKSDIFKVLTNITGIRTGGIQLAFELPNERGMLRPILDLLRNHNAVVISMFNFQENDCAPNRKVFIRLRPLASEAEAEVIEAVKAKFQYFLYWEPGLGKV